jgi:uncharacterized protein (TIGR00369 family)
MPAADSWATQRLDELVAGAAPPPVVLTLQLGTLDAWGPGWAKKTWQAAPGLLNSDGSLFGGYVAALADQILAFAAMTVVPADKVFRTTQLNVSFFKLGRHQALHIEGRVLSQSRQLIHVRAEFRDAAGELMAEASAIQVLTG